MNDITEPLTSGGDLLQDKGDKKRIIIIYYSGVGSTKKISEKIYDGLKNDFNAELYSVENFPGKLDLNSYQGLIIGFPVIHTHPAKRMLEFIDKIKRINNPKPAYIFTTCGWYSANTLRIFAKKCVDKNIITVIHRVYTGCPAADGSLLTPFIKSFFTFSKNIDRKINLDLEKFKSLANYDAIKLRMPRFKLYSILNYPNKLAGNLITFKIHVHKNKCINCGKCVKNCPHGALEKGESEYPVFIKSKCGKCYRCIHHCPQKALSLSKRKTPEKVIEM